MMDNEQNERLLKQFLTERVPQTIADEGFSSRVMQCLPPSRGRWLSTVWTMLCSIAIVVYVLSTVTWTTLYRISWHLPARILSFLHSIFWNELVMLSVYVSILAVLFTAVYTIFQTERRMV